MTASTARANRGEDLNPSDFIACDSCGIKLAANAIHNVLPTAVPRTVCTSCVHRISLHRRFYPQCPYDFHDLFDHNFTICTRAAARQIITKARSK
jgi:pyruvate/2-oxoacid:ferredoxin oxidoreductase beta subunit